MRIVGLDLSLSATGYADHTGTETIPAKAITGVERLSYLRQCIVAGKAISTDLVVIEGYSFGSHQAHSHALGELGGVIRLGLFDAGIPFAEIPPAVVKKYATGKGNASKEEVLIAAVRRFPAVAISNNNEADAHWLRQLALWHYAPEHPDVIAMPASHRVALDKVEWPTITERTPTP